MILGVLFFLAVFSTIDLAAQSKKQKKKEKKKKNQTKH
jgi:hypothetical protein